MDEKSRKAWMRYYEGLADYPQTRLDTCPCLYDTALSEGELLTRITLTHQKSVYSLNEDRNEFIHFGNKGWSIPIEGRLIPYTRHCIQVVSTLMESKRIAFYEEGQEARIELLVEEANLLAEDLVTKS